MTRTYLVTGSASGIGASLKGRLEAKGWRVIGVDLRDADIEADLATPAGRDAMAAQAARLCPDGLDGVAAAAGIAHPVPQTVSINFFGAIATLEGVRPLLAKASRPRAVAVCSTAALLPSELDAVGACLAGDEARALALLEARPELSYMTSKRALSLWLRRKAVSPEWAGAGILLNGIAPGVVETAMTAPVLANPEMLKMVAQANPMAVSGFAKPEEMAELLEFLLTFEGHYLVGQVIFNDGGTDALMRPDTF